MDANTTQLLFFGVIIVVIIVFMFRNGRKRQRDAAALTTGLQPGAEIMTDLRHLRHHRRRSTRPRTRSP